MLLIPTKANSKVQVPTHTYSQAVPNSIQGPSRNALQKTSKINQLVLCSPDITIGRAINKPSLNFSLLLSLILKSNLNHSSCQSFLQLSYINYSLFSLEVIKSESTRLTLGRGEFLLPLLTFSVQLSNFRLRKWSSTNFGKD